MTSGIEDEYLPLLADVLDAIDPELSDERQAEAALRARNANLDAAFALTLGILTGMTKVVSDINPETMRVLRKRAGRA